MELIAVLDSVKGKFGPQIKDEVGYLSFSPKYKGYKKFQPGTVLEAELYITDKGNRYINSAKVVSTGVVTKEAPIKVVRNPKVSIVPEAKPRDFDAENRGKTASLFVEALLSNPNVTVSLDSVDLDKMDKLVWDLVDLVFKTRK